MTALHSENCQSNWEGPHGGPYPCNCTLAQDEEILWSSANTATTGDMAQDYPAITALRDAWKATGKKRDKPEAIRAYDEVVELRAKLTGDESYWESRVARAEADADRLAEALIRAREAAGWSPQAEVLTAHAWAVAMREPAGNRRLP